MMYVVTTGVSHGSVIGPLLWNEMYYKMGGLRVPDEATVIGGGSNYKAHRRREI